MFSLNVVHLSSSTTNSGGCVCLPLDHSSFSMALSKPSNLILFCQPILFGNEKLHQRLKALAWLVVHKKVNIIDMLQVRRPYKSLSPHWCILCKGSGESVDHPFFFELPYNIGAMAQVIQSS